MKHMCPMPAINRGLFVGYHSDQDSFDRLEKLQIEETIDLLVDLVLELQRKS